jgi:hypothetical protein
MNLIYFIFGALFGLAGFRISRRFSLNETCTSVLVVIIVFSGMLIAKFMAIPHYRAATVGYFIKRDNPKIYLIGKAFPDAYQAYLTNVQRIILTEIDENLEVLELVGMLDALLPQSIPKASNQSIYNFYKTEMTLYNAVLNIDPKIVLFLEFESKFSHKPNPGLVFSLEGDERIQKLVAAESDVILSAIQNPQPPLTADEKDNAAKIFTDIITGLANQYGQDTYTMTMQDPSNSQLDKRSAALIVISFYQEMLNLGPDNAGIVFKYLNSPR